jgi:hypothetical protein
LFILDVKEWDKLNNIDIFRSSVNLSINMPSHVDRYFH